MRWDSTMFSTLRSIMCALWPLQLVALFFACCELVWFALKLKRTYSASNSNFSESGSGISSGIDHQSIAMARVIAANAAEGPLSIDDVVGSIGGNAHQRRKLRRLIGREIL